MREVIVKHYQFDELTDAAKERARDWWRQGETEEFGAHGELMEPYETAAKLLGIEFAQHAVRLMNGKDRMEPDIRWSGFGRQDGASFVGEYKYAKAAGKAVRAEFPTDLGLNCIANRLTEIQRQHGYKLSAKIDQSGSYVHKHTMAAEVYKGQDDAPEDAAKEILESMRDFAQWIWDGLRQEYEYRMGDECVEESIRANEYEFLASGEIA
jgi:hypothetical protein